MAEKTITIHNQEVNLRYCAASEQAFESLADKGIGDIDFTKTNDILKMSWACIIAAYGYKDKQEPISIKDLLYEAEPNELIQLFTTVIELRKEWYNVSKVVENQLKQEAEQAGEDFSKNE